MLLHYQIIPEITSQFKSILGISKIILFGSVAKKTANSKSDLDLAIIIENETRSMFFSFEPEDGIPIELLNQTNKIKEKIYTKYKIELHLSFYYNEEYEKGIIFSSNYVTPTLNQTGIILHENEYLF